MGDGDDFCEQPNAAIAGISNVKATRELRFISDIPRNDILGLHHRNDHDQAQPKQQRGNHDTNSNVSLFELFLDIQS